MGQPRIVLSTVVAFNLRDQKIVYRQENLGQLDFAALERAAQSRTSGTIDINALRDPQGETRFVTRFLTDELGDRADSSDAIIIVSSKVSLDRKVSLDSLKAKGSGVRPLLYMNYNPNLDESWPDTLRSALKAYKGATAYDIAAPRDVGVAIKELLSRTDKRPNS